MCNPTTSKQTRWSYHSVQHLITLKAIRSQIKFQMSWETETERNQTTHRCLRSSKCKVMFTVFTEGSRRGGEQTSACIRTTARTAWMNELARSRFWMKRNTSRKYQLPRVFGGGGLKWVIEKLKEGWYPANLFSIDRHANATQWNIFTFTIHLI